MTLSVGAAALVVAGCGADDGPSQAGASKTQTKNEYIRQADAICADLKTTALRFEKQLSELGRDAEARDIAPIIKNGLELSRKALARLRALPAPSEDRGMLDAYLAARAKSLDVASGLVAADEANDIGKARQIGRDVRPLQDEERRLAASYGFTVCL